MNLAGVSEDFGPHSRSVVLYACQIFFYEKFLWTDFFLEQGSEFFWKEVWKIFGRKFCLGFRMTEAEFFCLMPSRIFQKTEKDFLKTASDFLERGKEIFFETEWKNFWNASEFFRDRKKFFLVDRRKFFLKTYQNFFWDGKIFWWTEWKFFLKRIGIFF